MSCRTSYCSWFRYYSTVKWQSLFPLAVHVHLWSYSSTNVSCTCVVFIFSLRPTTVSSRLPVSVKSTSIIYDSQWQFLCGFAVLQLGLTATYSNSALCYHGDPLPHRCSSLSRTMIVHWPGSSSLEPCRVRRLDTSFTGTSAQKWTPLSSTNALGFFSRLTCVAVGRLCLWVVWVVWAVCGCRMCESYVRL